VFGYCGISKIWFHTNLTPADTSKLSIAHPRSVNRGSKCFPCIGQKINSLESNCEFSGESRNFCRSNGKLLIFTNLSLHNCSFIKGRSFDESTVETIYLPGLRLWHFGGSEQNRIPFFCISSRATC